MIKVCMILGIMISMFSVCYAADNIPLDFNIYDGTSIGAKAIGMGEAFVALADTADAPVWNPAGLSMIPVNIFTLGSNAYIDTKEELNDVLRNEPLRTKKLVYFAFASKKGGLSWRALSDYKESTYSDNGVQQVWSDKEIKVQKFSLSVANNYSPALICGLNINYFHGQFGLQQKKSISGVWQEPEVNIDNGGGWGLDTGFLYKMGAYSRLGIVLENLPAYIYWNDYSKDRLPLISRVGTAMTFANMLTITYDYEHRKYYKPQKFSRKIYHMGVEQSIMDTVFLRAGMYGEDWNETKAMTYSLGIGYTKENYFFDVAVKRFFVDLSSDSAVSLYTEDAVFRYVVSVSFPFD